MVGEKVRSLTVAFSFALIVLSNENFDLAMLVDVTTLFRQRVSKRISSSLEVHRSFPENSWS
jgi:hypothetical protein